MPLYPSPRTTNRATPSGAPPPPSATTLPAVRSRHTVAVSDDAFKVELESDPDDVLAVRLDGELDMAHADWVDETLAAASAHHRRIAVQLDAITFLDSAGIRVLQ